MLDAPPSMILDVAPIPSVSISTPPSPHLETCVIIPARDEANRVVAALDALAHQVTDEGRLFDPARYEVVLLANNCRDATAMVARRYAATHPNLALHVVDLTLPPDQAHVG